MLSCPVPSANALPLGFQDEFVARMPTETLVVSGAIAYRENGDLLMFFASKMGEVYAAVNPFRGSFEIEHLVTLPVCSNRARGIQSILPHPEFAYNNWLYIYKTDLAESCEVEAEVAKPQNRLSRFTVTYRDRPDGRPGKIPVLDASNERTLFLGPELLGAIHNGGGMDFGKDGMLWIVLGDGDDRPRHAYNPQAINSAVLRITEDGDIPTDNPYYLKGGPRCNETGFMPPGNPGRWCPEIWAQGLRSPYSIAMNPFTDEGVVEFWIGDVGGSKWEELNVAGTRYMGTNYGWDRYEGPCRQGRTTHCFRHWRYADPVHWWEHTGGQGCVIAGEFVRDDINWPREYHGRFIFADYTFNTIYILNNSTGEHCRSCTPPTSKYGNETLVANAVGVVDFFWGPHEHEGTMSDTALYYLKLGYTPELTGRFTGGTLRRIRYTGGTNRAPQAVLSSTALRVDVGEFVFFSCKDSLDFDNDALTCYFDYGDGSPVETTDALGKEASHAYPERGSYMVDLIVEDTNGYTDQAYMTIQVGKPPEVFIDFPPEGATFAVGNKFYLSGRAYAFDDDGVTRLPIPDENIHWEVRQVHADHWHVFLASTPGNHVPIDPAPKPEDYEAATNSYLLIQATAEDEFGRTTMVERAVLPRLALLDLYTVPPGLVISVDLAPFETRNDGSPGEVVSWENNDLELFAEDQDGYIFCGYQVDNGLQERPSLVKTRQHVLEHLCSGGACEYRPIVQAVYSIEGVEDCDTMPLPPLPPSRPLSDPTAAPTAAPYEPLIPNRLQKLTIPSSEEGEAVPGRFGHYCALDAGTVLVTARYPPPVPGREYDSLTDIGTVFLYDGPNEGTGWWYFRGNVSNIHPSARGLFKEDSAIEGDVMVIARCQNQSNVACIFHRQQGDDPSSQSWLLTQSITLTGEVMSVGIHNRTIVLGVPDARVRSVFLYDSPSGEPGSWTLSQPAIAETAADGFGASIKLAGDYLIVGAALSGTFPHYRSGTAYLYARNGSNTPFELMQQLVSTQERPRKDRSFGWHVDLAVIPTNTSNEGTFVEGDVVAVVGAPNINAESRGFASVFLASAGWTEQAVLRGRFESDLVEDHFGFNVATDGTRILVLGPLDGSLFSYWVDGLEPEGLIDFSPHQPESIDMSSDGHACVGVPLANQAFALNFNNVSYPTGPSAITAVTFEPTTRELTITQGGADFIAAIDVDDADSDPSNELITSIDFQDDGGGQGRLTITEGSATDIRKIEGDVSVDIDDGDSDPTNERISSVELDANGDLTLTEAGRSFTVNIPEARQDPLPSRSRNLSEMVTPMRRVSLVASIPVLDLAEDTGTVVVEYNNTDKNDGFIPDRSGSLIGFSVMLNRPFRCESVVDISVQVLRRGGQGSSVVSSSESGKLFSGRRIKAVRFAKPVHFEAGDKIQFMVEVIGERVPRKVQASLVLLADIPEAHPRRRPTGHEKNQRATGRNGNKSDPFATVQSTSLQASVLLNKASAKVKYSGNSGTSDADAFVMAHPGKFAGFSIVLNEPFRSQSLVEVMIVINDNPVPEESAMLHRGDVIKAVKFTRPVDVKAKDIVRFFVAVEGEILQPKKIGASLLLLLEQRFLFDGGMGSIA